MNNEQAEILANKVEDVIGRRVYLVWREGEKGYELRLKNMEDGTIVMFEGSSWEEAFEKAGVRICKYCNGNGQIEKIDDQMNGELGTCDSCGGRGYTLIGEGSRP